MVTTVLVESKWRNLTDHHCRNLTLLLGMYQRTCSLVGVDVRYLKATKVNVYLIKRVCWNYMDSVTLILQVMWIHAKPLADMHRAPKKIFW